MLRFLTLLTIAASIGCSSNRAPDELATALRGSTKLELFSLDPKKRDENAAPTFHNWTELGSTDVSNAALRTRLLDSLDAAIADHDGVVANCFWPRHGLRAMYKGKTFEVLICFQCYQAQWYIDGIEQEDFLLARNAQKTFDTILTDAGVNLPPAARQ